MEKHPKIIAVITGDMVGSTRLEPGSRRATLAGLESCLASENLKRLADDPELLAWQIFRGDAFQCALARPEFSLHAALYLTVCMRAGGIAQQAVSTRVGSEPGDEAHQGGDEPGARSEAADIRLRVAIGLGSLEHRDTAGDLGKWDGEAFRFSGKLLDELKGDDGRIALRSPWPELNDELEVECHFLDAIASGWTQAQSYAILSMLRGETQERAAEGAGISQSAMAQRLKSAHGKTVRRFLDRFEVLVQRIISLRANILENKDKSL